MAGGTIAQQQAPPKPPLLLRPTPVNSIATQLKRLSEFHPKRGNDVGPSSAAAASARAVVEPPPDRLADADWKPPALTEPARPRPVLPPASPARTKEPAVEPFQPEPYESRDMREISPRLIVPEPGTQLPPREPLPESRAPLREWTPEPFHWQPTALRYYPLYFEDFPLERYGHSLGCLQPIWTTGQFYTQLMLLPYEMGLDPPHKPLYALGYHRPGDPAQRLWYQIPVNAAAVVGEAAALTLVPVIFP